MKISYQAISVLALTALSPLSVAANGTPLTPITPVVHTSIATDSASSFAGMFRDFVARLLEGGEEVAASEPSATVAAKAVTAPRLEFEHTKKVDDFVRFYSEGRGRRTMQIGIARSHEMRDRAAEIFAEEGVPTELVWLAQVESVWKNEANSQMGACGVWQFMPATAERFGLECGEGIDEREDFEKSTRAAARYLRILNKRYDGDWELAIGAYNCGEGNMDKAIERGGAAHFWTLVEKDVLPDETAAYVPKVLAASIVGSRAG